MQFFTFNCFYIINGSKVVCFMSYPISKNINPYQYQQQQQQQQQSVAMGVNGPNGLGVNSPQLQNLDPERIRQNIASSNNLVTQAAEKKDPGLILGVTLPVWFGISKLMEKFNKACATKLDSNGNLIKNSSMLDKVRDFGDKIGKKFEGPKFKKASELLNKIKGFWAKRVDKSPVLTAIFKTPVEPKNSMARIMSKGTLAETANDATQAFTAFVKDAKGKYIPERLKQLGITAEQLEAMCKNDYAHVDDIIKACDRVLAKNPKEFIELAYSNGTQFAPVKKVVRDKIFGIFGDNGKKAYKTIFGREIRFSELKNKLLALKGVNNPNATTKIGGILPKVFLRTMEGLTNGTAGGKFIIAMQAYFYADALIAAAKAKKGEKGKTFAESTINNLSYYLLMPLGLGIMYGLGGLKYIGMSPAEVAKYREKLAKFNKDVEAGLLTDKSAYKAAKTQLRDALKGSTKVVKQDALGKAVPSGKRALQHLKNVVYNPLKTAGKVIATGLEPIRPYLAKGSSDNIILKGLKNIGYNFKRAAGYPLRFGAYMFLIAPPLVNLATKAGHLIFGKPEKSILDEGKQPEKNQIISPVTQDQSAQASNQVQMPNQPQMPMQPIAQQNPAYSQPQMMQPQAQNQVNVIKPNPEQIAAAAATQGITRSYIPSSQPVQLDPTRFDEENQKLAAADKKLTAAEKKAKKHVEKK